ncbi:hypothetical protein BDV41DRAFT_388812 [Aspergillus transmontanensis]|uniref:Uncharacterized protein n=1 Tax=Aspergillus transmontanensis TaxID=1034304 RepID=A0A5N6VPZ9_9EURO|nr:hypothetical protein BDV41DRAFT_388812 [Aspergillus transmontanensis]
MTSRSLSKSAFKRLIHGSEQGALSDTSGCFCCESFAPLIGPLPNPSPRSVLWQFEISQHETGKRLSPVPTATWRRREKYKLPWRQTKMGRSDPDAMASMTGSSALVQLGVRRLTHPTVAYDAHLASEVDGADIVNARSHDLHKKKCKKENCEILSSIL